LRSRDNSGPKLVRLGLLTALAGLLAAAPATSQSLEYAPVQVAEGVHLFKSPDPGAGNSVAIISEGEALVVDATASPRAARAMVAELERLGVQTLRGVVNTHWHQDHVLGTQAFLERFPEAPVIAQHGTPVDMQEHMITDLASQIERIQARLAQRDSLLGVGTNSAGEPMTQAEREALEQRQTLFRDLVGGLEEVEPVLPNLTFSQDAQMRVGALTVHLEYLGPAHSFSDVVVRVPARGVLLAGDLVTKPYPGAADGFSSITGWAETLDKMLGMEFDVVIPGHGDAMSTREYLEDLHGLFYLLLDQVAGGLSRGEPLETITEGIDLSDFVASHVGQDERRIAGFKALFATPAAAIAYRELTDRRNLR